MVLSPLDVTSERGNAIDFITPYLGTSGLQVLRKGLKPSQFLFLDVFSGTVWLSWLAVIMLTSILVYVFQRFLKSVQHNLNVVTSTCFGDAIWFVVSSVCFEGEIILV